MGEGCAECSRGRSKYRERNKFFIEDYFIAAKLEVASG
jgi:hypothetical protein